MLHFAANNDNWTIEMRFDVNLSSMYGSILLSAGCIFLTWGILTQCTNVPCCSSSVWCTCGQVNWETHDCNSPSATCTVPLLLSLQPVLGDLVLVISDVITVSPAGCHAPEESSSLMGQGLSTMQVNTICIFCVEALSSFSDSLFFCVFLMLIAGTLFSVNHGNVCNRHTEKAACTCQGMRLMEICLAALCMVLLSRYVTRPSLCLCPWERDRETGTSDSSLIGYIVEMLPNLTLF